MGREYRRAGLLAGLLVGTTVAGVLYLLSALRLVSFVPLDVANGVIELTPGQIATTTIETIGEWGKRLLIGGGVGGFVLAFGGLGMALAALLGRRGRSPLLLGALAGLLPLAVTLPIQYLVVANRATIPAGATPPALLAAVYIAAGVTLAWAIRGLAGGAMAGEVERVPGARRAFLLTGGGALVSLAAGSALLARVVPRREARGVGALLPTPATALPARAEDATATAVVEQAATTPGPTTAPARDEATRTPAAAAEATSTASATPSESEAAAETATELPQPSAAPAPAASATAEPPAFVAAPGTRPEITAQDSLYVISSSTRDPEIDPQSWRLKIHGAVQNPYSLTYNELLALPRQDQTSTMECISNEVGNLLIGNCNWNGAPLRDVLLRAGVSDGVVDVVFRAAEGYSDSVPLALALDPATLIAYGIDGAALSVKHGFPARIRIAGQYGEKNVKWLTEIELVRVDYKGYWQQRGWNDDATIFTTSVFDTGNPHLGDGRVKLENGSVPLGGIAFAGSRGIRGVELQLDGGPWQPARLKEPSLDITWRLWRYDWTTTVGPHTIVVRATDGQGDPQIEAVQATHPDGATGYHRLDVEVV